MSQFRVHSGLNNVWELLNSQPSPEPLNSSQIRWEVKFAVENDTGVLIKRIHIKSRLLLNKLVLIVLQETSGLFSGGIVPRVPDSSLLKIRPE